MDPKKVQYIGDDNVIVGLVGLRTVSRLDTSYRLSELSEPDNTLYELKYSYKGQDFSVRYDDKELRDKMYGQLRTALCKGVTDDLKEC